MASRPDHIANEPPPEYASPTSTEPLSSPLSPLSRRETESYGHKKAGTGFSDFDKIEGPRGRLVDGDDDDDSELIHNAPARTATDFITEVIHAEDDPSLNPWTFRTWFVGLGLSAFGGALGTIYYFKPQTLTVSTIFLGVISYVLGELMARIIPRWGWIGKLLNPHPFNRKEHAAILIMASTSSAAPLAIEVLAINKLFYNKPTPPLAAILCIMSSQCIGYGIAGILRNTLIYPSKMLYPGNFPLVALIEVLNGVRSVVKKRLRVFWIAFVILFFWEALPQYMMPFLTGISIFCLANRNSLTFTNIFGGSNGNEGMGVLSIALDLQYVTTSGLWYPWATLVNELIGYLICIVVFAGIYYGNVWDALKFPFLSQALFTSESNSTNFVQFNQTQVLTPDYTVDDELLSEQGLPYFTGTFVLSILVANLAITATFSHLLCWNYDEIKSAWSFASPSNVRRNADPRRWKWAFWRHASDSRPKDTTDPHLKLMLAYEDAPNWWYGATFVIAVALGFTACYLAESTLPWWGFSVSVLIAATNILFFGAQYAITAFLFNTQTLIQMIGGYMHPGKPVANMYFTLFGYNSVSQGQLLLRDLKLGQYVHLSPRCTFCMQMMGTVLGGLVSYFVMNSITDAQREILLDLDGTNVWSGQLLQQYNSQAVAWGGLANKLFSSGSRYQWVTWAFILGFFVPLPLYFLHRRLPHLRLDFLNTAIIAYNVGTLSVGINSSPLMLFASGFVSQYYLRKHRPVWFKKYNYILSAGLDGGCQVMVFLLTFAFMGGAGKVVKFPTYWGNNVDGNFDLCMKNPALGSGGGGGGGGGE